MKLWCCFCMGITSIPCGHQPSFFLDSRTSLFQGGKGKSVMAQLKAHSFWYSSGVCGLWMIHFPIYSFEPLPCSALCYLTLELSPRQYIYDRYITVGKGHLAITLNLLTVGQPFALNPSQFHNTCKQSKLIYSEEIDSYLTPFSSLQAYIFFPSLFFNQRLCAGTYNHGLAA